MYSPGLFKATCTFTILCSFFVKELECSEWKATTSALDCVEEFNQVRSLAGLEPFSAAKNDENDNNNTIIIPDAPDAPDGDGFWESVCGKVYPVTPTDPPTSTSTSTSTTTSTTTSTSTSASTTAAPTTTPTTTEETTTSNGTTRKKDLFNMKKKSENNPLFGGVKVLSSDDYRLVSALNRKFVSAGTWGYLAVSEGKPTCKLAAEQWKNAFNNFKGLPPAYKENETLYKDPQNVSFVALYNPQPAPKLSCKTFVCQNNSKNNRNNINKDGTAGDNNNKTGLLCLSSPPALKQETAPFTQEQWDKISSSLSSSAKSALPHIIFLLGIIFSSFFMR